MMGRNYGILLLGRFKANNPSFIESDGAFITKPLEIANYFIKKVDSLRHNI